MASNQQSSWKHRHRFGLEQWKRVCDERGLGSQKTRRCDVVQRGVQSLDRGLRPMIPSKLDRQRERANIVRSACGAFDDKGNDFEKLTGDLLREFGFFNVRRQRAGQQFGRDISARLDAIDGGDATHWYFECKNLKDAIGAGEVAHKLIWHLSRELLTGGFVIVGPGKLSNEVVGLDAVQIEVHESQPAGSGDQLFAEVRLRFEPLGDVAIKGPLRLLDEPLVGRD
jgi:restriction endonuclease